MSAADQPREKRDKPEPSVDIVWEVDHSPKPVQRARLLEILFGDDVTA